MGGMAAGATTGADLANQNLGASPEIIDNSARSDFVRGWDNTLDFIDSEAGGYVMAGVGVAVPTAIAGGATLIGGAGIGAAGSAALAAAGPAALAGLVGLGAAKLGSFGGEFLGHAAMSTVGSWLGYEPLPEQGEMPATVGHPIAHVSTWATIGAMALGALAAVAVGAFIIGTGGMGLGVVLLAAAAGGLVGGLGAGFASAAGQYGKNKGEIATGSPNVHFQGKPVARVEDLVNCENHGPTKQVAEGAETVFANNKPIARIGHKTNCDGTINDGVPSIAIDMDTSPYALDIDPGMLQRIVRTGIVLLDFLPGPKGNKGDTPGGTPTPKPDAAMPVRAPDGDAPTAPKPDPVSNTRPDGDGGPNNPAPKPDPGPSNKPPASRPDGDGGPNNKPNNKPDADNAGSTTPKPRPDDGAPAQPKPRDRQPENTQSEPVKSKPKATETKAGDPVDVASGQVSETRTDIAIPGTIPLVLTRSYAPGCEGIQGRHWAGTWAQHLVVNGPEIIYQDDEGVLITFHAPNEQVNATNIRFPHLTLAGERSGMLYVFDRRSQTFTIFEHRIRNRVLLSRLQDRNGNRIRFVYDDSGLKEVLHSDGFSLSVESRDMVIRRAVLNAPGSTDCGFVWNYTSANILSESISSQTGTLRYTYDEQERLTGWADTRLTRAHYEYGPHGRVIRNWSDSGHMGCTLEYDLDARRTISTDAVGAVTIFDWNERGLVWREIDPLGAEWLTEWGRSFNVLSRTDPLGNVTRYSYDSQGDLVGLAHPDGTSESWSYYLSGRVRSHTDSSGATHLFRYDDRGNLASVQQPDGNILRYRRAPNGQVLRIDYPGGKQERFYYDMLQRPRMLRTVAGFEQQMQHDAEGRLVRFSDEIGAETTWDHSRGPENPRGNMRSVTLPDGSTTHAAYDGEGLLTTVTNGEGATRRMEYGAFDLLLGMTDEQGHRLRFEHDAMTRLTAIVNQKGERYEISYDTAGRIRAERDYAGLVTRYDYDAAGRLTGALMPDGSRRAYLRNKAGQLTELQFIRGAELSRSRFAYDVAGRLIRAETAESVVEYGYDIMGRITSERLNGREIRSEYAPDGSGRIARTGDVLPLASSYNAAGQVEELRIGNHDALRFAYDPRGLETMRSSQAGFALTQGYSNLGLLVEQIAGPLSALPEEVRYGALTGDHRNDHITRAGALAHRTYQWDRAHRPVSVNDRITGEKRFDYDPRGQVVGVTKTSRHGDTTLVSRFGYDPSQNLTEIATGMAREKVSQDAGRVRQRGHVHYTHDDAGRVIEKRIEEPGFRPRIWRMGWNAQGHLVRLETPQGAVWRYVYDALGRRIQRLKVVSGGREDADSPGFIPAGQGRAYQWEGTRIVAEAPLGPDGAPDWEQAAHWIYDPGSYRPLARAAGDELHYLVTDHIGTPREMFTQDGTAVAWRQDLSLWGQPEALDLPSRKYAANLDHAPTCPIRFQGQWEDEESGLYYNNQRYYDPDATQYLSPDPIGLMGGLRPQAYVADPNSWVDPMGLEGCGSTVPQYSTPFQPLTPSQRSAIQARIDARTATRAEYQHLNWDRRFSNRRNRGVSRFWAQERRALRAGGPGTRDWSPQQRNDIIAGRTPTFDGQPIEGHHKYNALDHPQLADDPSNIYPATRNEHQHRWHGGNWQNDTYGVPNNPNYPEDF